MKELNYNTSPVFLANYNAYQDDQYKIMCNQGGTRSGKTYSIVQLLVMIALTDPNIKISIVSSTLPHIKRGVLRDFQAVLETLNIYDDKSFNRSDFVYKFNNGSFVEFFSADDSNKLRGLGRDVLFVNEANLLSHDDWRQLILRTTHKSFIDYNPVDEFSWIYDHVIPREDCKFIQSCYLDNYDFLPQSQIEEIERLKDTDPHQWEIFGLGNVSKATNLIFTNFTINRITSKSEAVYGIDFGFNNPTAVVQVQADGNKLSVTQLLYETGLTNSDLIAKLKYLVPNKTDYIYADSAEPNRIEEIKRAGYNIWAADKNVKAGIDFTKRFDIVISPDSVELIKEIKSYKWKSDKNDVILDDPIKVNDHAVDAMRYAIFTHGQKHWTQSQFTLPKLNKIVTKTNKYANY